MGGSNNWTVQICHRCNKEFECAYIERYCADCDPWGE